MQSPPKRLRSAISMKTSRIKSKKKLIRDNIFIKTSFKFKSLGTVKYSFSHFDLETEVFLIVVKKNIFKDQKWIKINNINKVELPTVMKKIVSVAI